MLLHWGPNSSAGQGWKTGCSNCCLNLRELVLFSHLTELLVTAFYDSAFPYFDASVLQLSLLSILVALYASSWLSPLSPFNMKDRLYIVGVYLNCFVRTQWQASAEITFTILYKSFFQVRHTWSPALVAHPCLLSQCQCYCWLHLPVCLWWAESSKKGSVLS